jgi:hypothetical protein
MTRKLTLIFILAVAGTMTAHAQDQSPEHEREHHAAHGGAELDLARPDSGKWASDESLRQGMSELRSAFESHHTDYKEGNFDAGRAAELADSVEENVNFMFANCRLPADADAELHKLLAAALGAAQSLRESDNPHEGLHQLHQVLKAYPEFFDHPGWAG